MRTRGIFITFEGTEGAGKSTVIRLLAQKLRQNSYPVILTREPGGRPLAEKIRRILLHEAMDPWTEVFLYEAARADHVSRVLRPALEKRNIVLCDRFTDSTLAYQGYARNLPWKKIQCLNQIATQGLCPDLTILLDIDPKVGLQRAQVQTRFEAEGIRFQTRVRQGYEKCQRAKPRRWLILDANAKTPNQLTDAIWHHLRNRLKKFHG